MANKKYKLDGNDYWEASGVYDIGQGDTQRNINDEVATKLATIAEGAEVNQNAFSNVTVGGTTIAADSKTDTLTLTAGSNITLTPNATNDSVTIAANDTTYDNATRSAAGLMSAADKTKLDTLDSADITDNSTVGGSTVEASLTSLKGSLTNKLNVYETTTESPIGIPTNEEIISSLALGGNTDSFVVKFKLSNNNIAFTVIWSKVSTSGAEGIGFGYYTRNGAGRALYQFHYANSVLNYSILQYIQEQITPYIETSFTATRAYSIGQFIAIEGVLYRVIASIANGATITPNTNVITDVISNHLPIAENITLDLSGMASNITDRGSFCKKYGKIVMLSINVEVTGTASSTMRAILPSNCRPLSRIYSVMQNGIGTGFVSVNVTTTGDVLIYPDNSGYCQGYITFIVE